jgi:alginate O-acetyltransferase complex protein AlgI
MFASLGFYAWGEPLFVLVMIGSIAVNWFLGLQAGRCADSRKAQKVIAALVVAANIGILFVFKYLSFFANTLTGSQALNIALPIGISFFTFQAMSYVFDIQRGRGQARKNPLDVALYISFFPQLIAGRF